MRLLVKGYLYLFCKADICLSCNSWYYSCQRLLHKRGECVIFHCIDPLTSSACGLKGALPAGATGVESSHDYARLRRNRLLSLSLTPSLPPEFILPFNILFNSLVEAGFSWSRQPAVYRHHCCQNFAGYFAFARDKNERRSLWLSPEPTSKRIAYFAFRSSRMKKWTKRKVAMKIVFYRIYLPCLCKGWKW